MWRNAAAAGALLRAFKTFDPANLGYVSADTLINGLVQCGVPPEETALDAAPPELEMLDMVLGLPARVPLPQSLNRKVTVKSPLCAPAYLNRRSSPSSNMIR